MYSLHRTGVGMCLNELERLRHREILCVVDLSRGGHCRMLQPGVCARAGMCLLLMGPGMHVWVCMYGYVVCG